MVFGTNDDAGKGRCDANSAYAVMLRAMRRIGKAFAWVWIHFASSCLVHYVCMVGLVRDSAYAVHVIINQLIKSYYQPVVWMPIVCSISLVG
jgi:hypothetical protein